MQPKSPSRKAPILKKIDRLKKSPFGEVGVESTFAGRRYALLLLTEESIEEREIIKLLAKWRKPVQHWFPSQFRVTISGTRKWLKDKVLDVPDRLLFMIKTDKGYIGHVGLNRLNAKKLTIELDNIVRGEPVYSGIMSHALQTLMRWGKKTLGVGNFHLQTASDNERALRFYQRLGFAEVKRVPLIQVTQGEVTSWIEAPVSHHKPIKRYNIFMELSP